MLNLLGNATTAISKTPFRRGSPKPLPQALTDAIPLEIYEIIIDFLHNDRRALSSCALVCKAWLASSQYHLLYEITITQRNYRQFLQFVRRSTESRALVLARVHTLTIVQAIRARRCWSHDFIPYMTGFPIKNLTFDRLSPSDPSNYDMVPHPPTFSGDLAQSLTGLQLYMSKFKSLTHLVEMVCLFRNLERLSIDSATWFPAQLAFPSPEQYVLPLGLQELNVCLQRYDGTLTEFMQWLEQYHGSALPPLQRLSVRSQPSANDRYVYTQTAARVLNTLGASLCHLTVANFYEPRVTLAYPGLFASNTKLRTLCLRDIDLRYRGSPTPELRVPWIPAFLSQIATTSIEVVEFEILLKDVGHLHVLPWDEMGRVFVQPQFARLTRLEFKVSVAWQKGATRWIGARLPLELMQRGIVCVSALH